MREVLLGISMGILVSFMTLWPGISEAQQRMAPPPIPPSQGEGSVAPMPPPRGGPVPPMAALIDDSEQGVLRLGRVQILWGEAMVTCESPATVCQVSVTFPKAFASPPTVNFTNVADYNTQKFAFTSVYLSSLRAESFDARVTLQANIAPLKRVPWLAIGYWR